MKLSVVIITKNEEHNIRRCLESVKWADDIILVDSQSTDKTVEIAGEYGAKIFSPEWKGYGFAKREGVNKPIKQLISPVNMELRFFHLNGKDMALPNEKGSTMLPENGCSQLMPTKKLLLNWLKKLK